MAADINLVILIGRLTRDSELRYNSSGTAIATFSIAVNRRTKRGDQWEDVASFFDLTLWDKQAEGLNKYLVKGTQVAVQGELRQDRWEKDGQRFSKVQVFANSIQLLGSPRESQSGPTGGTRAAPQQRPAAEDFDPHAYEDDIPF